MTVVTRFAPSPTGLLHIGGARTALFNYLFAKHNNGKFLLRVEDTDKTRSTQEAKEAIIEGLKWLGLENDGDIFYQSENENRHKEIAQKLLDSGHAYYCYVGADELVELRKSAEKEGKAFRFQSPYRDSDLAAKDGVKPVIRIKAPKDGVSIIKDEVQGEVKVANSEIDDMIILRGDGTPTYNLAVVVDDYDMGVTHIIRGDDHLNNSFKQKLIYDALEWELPKVAHIPLIYGPDGTKMSKRHGATNVMEYKDMGYLAKAMRNYLLRLGWSHGDSEIISDEEAKKWFDLDKVGKSPSRFDFDKLNNLNKHYIKEADEDYIFELMQIDKNDKNSKAITFVKERASSLNDLKDGLKIYQDDYSQNLEEKETNIIYQKSELLVDIKSILERIENWNLDEIKDSLLNYANDNDLKMKDFGPALRVVLTFSSSSAGGIFEILDLLGKEESLQRFKNIKS